MGVAAGVCAIAIAAAAVVDKCSIAARHRSHAVISSNPRQSPRTRAAPRVSSSARAGRTSTRSIICRRPRRLWKPSTWRAGVVSTRQVWRPRGRRGFKGVQVACRRGLSTLAAASPCHRASPTPPRPRPSRSGAAARTHASPARSQRARPICTSAARPPGQKHSHSEYEHPPENSPRRDAISLGRDMIDSAGGRLQDEPAAAPTMFRPTDAARPLIQPAAEQHIRGAACGRKRLRARPTIDLRPCESGRHHVSIISSPTCNHVAIASSLSHQPRGLTRCQVSRRGRCERANGARSAA